MSVPDAGTDADADAVEDTDADAGSRELLSRVDAYYDTVPRATARVEEHGSMTLFVAKRGWPFYARPSIARTSEPTTDEVRAVLARQGELGVPRALEWIHQSAPSLTEVARSAGMTVHQCPLLVLGSLVEPRPADAGLRLMGARDSELGDVCAAIQVAFSSPGTAAGEVGVAERDRAARKAGAAGRKASTADALKAGRTVQVGAFVTGAGAAGGGSHNPRGLVSEIVGVGVLPAFRRRGLAAAVAHLLAGDALEHGVTTVFCGAESDDVARVYEQVGFRRVGTTCIAEIS
jgi:ribosomal protein S18 acetylase RimI-like enzyme